MPEENTAVIIQFDIEKIDIHKLLEIEKLFQEIGITFDTGAGCGSRDWQWDFSLSGPVKVSQIENDETKEEKEPFDPCPECGAHLGHGPGGGAKCTKCDYWFCY